MITLPYVTRALGSVANGKIAFATSIVNYFSMFAQLGIPTYGIRACAQVRDDKYKLSQKLFRFLATKGYDFECCSEIVKKVVKRQDIWE